MTVDKNIYIDFSIIQKSDPKKLREELEVLIQLRNKIYIWSKVVSPLQMRMFCLGIKYKDITNKVIHNRIIELRKEKKTYNEIAQETGVPMKQLSFYLTTSPDKEWTLDDWIMDYHPKDSTMYAKADVVVDPDPKFVERFQFKGIEANCIEKIK